MRRRGRGRASDKRTRTNNTVKKPNSQTQQPEPLYELPELAYVVSFGLCWKKGHKIHVLFFLFYLKMTSLAPLRVQS